MNIERISPQDMKKRLDRGERLVVLDTRAPDAWKTADKQIPGSIRVPPEEIARHLDDVPRGRPVVSYCT